MAEQLDFREGLATITKLVVNLADQISTPVVLIDGRAGAGKSSFAKELQDSLFRALEVSPRLISMDDLYPGWDGLAAGSLYLEQNILQPLQLGREANWQVWDWSRSARGSDTEPGNGWRSFAGGNILIVEGCGSISKGTAPLAQVKVWIEADASLRKQRFSQRDAGLFDDKWSTWAAQEDDFYAENKTQELADYSISN